MAINVLSNICILNLSEPLTNVEALTLMGNKAVEAKWAKPGFVEAVLAREEKYATGLHTAGVEVAIPHADPEWTIDPGMVIGVCDQPVVFQPMGGLGGDVHARFIFLLAIPDAEAHISFLQALAGFIEDGERLSELERTKDVSALIEYLQQTVEA
ncbi:MAG TPA: PTS sugar transporter subunit IIA [Anaerolineaceae bacterium]|nr:PTS sugar transporter subunit IIA [Anaerolineaceae bacterium]